MKLSLITALILLTGTSARIGSPAAHRNLGGFEAPVARPIVTKGGAFGSAPTSTSGYSVAMGIDILRLHLIRFLEKTMLQCLAYMNEIRQ